MSVEETTEAALSGTNPLQQKPGHGLHHPGYRGWTGDLEAGWKRSLVIASVCIRRAWLSTWLKRMLLLAWLPAVWFGVGFFIWEQAVLDPAWRRSMVPFLQGAPQTPEFMAISDALRSGDLEAGRHTVWAWLLQSFFRYPQGVLMVMVVGVIAPPLISQDIRSRAFLVYFSRPLTRGEYLIGKLAGIWVYLSAISTAPALCLYVLGILLSPGLNVIEATWDLPLRILAASAVLMLPTSILALCFSSLTQESRYAGFAWFVTWILGWFTYGIVTSAGAFGGRDVLTQESPWTHLSLYHTLGRIQRWIFGFSDFRDALISTVILLGVTVVSMLILIRRISAPMRV